MRLQKVLPSRPLGKRIEVLAVYPFGTHPKKGQSPQVNALAEEAAKWVEKYQNNLDWVLFMGGWAGEDGEPEATQMERLVRAILCQKGLSLDKIVRKGVFSEVLTNDTHQQTMFIKELMENGGICDIRARPSLHILAEELHFPRCLRYTRRKIELAEVTGWPSHDAHLAWANSKAILRNRPLYQLRELAMAQLYEINYIPSGMSRYLSR